MLEPKIKTYFAVATSDSYNSYGRIVNAACGHKHRSSWTAEACREKLQRTDRTGNSSAKWYNATVLEIDETGIGHTPAYE